MSTPAGSAMDTPWNLVATSIEAARLASPEPRAPGHSEHGQANQPGDAIRHERHPPRRGTAAALTQKPARAHQTVPGNDSTSTTSAITIGLTHLAHKVLPLRLHARRPRNVRTVPAQKAAWRET
jgi:hypothetical protein